MKHCLPPGASYTVMVLFVLLTAACSAKHYTRTAGNSVTFYYENSTAKEVMFASSIDQYNYHPAKIIRDDVWEVTVPLEKEFDYFYIVDGVITLPDCQLSVTDDFGSKNCLFVSGL